MRYLFAAHSLIFFFLITVPFNILHSQDTIAGHNRISTFTVAAAGDIMLGTSFPGKRYLPSGDNPYPLMTDLFGDLSGADITFGNLEGPFSDDADLTKKCRDTTTCYAFRVPERYAGVLDSAGFDFISLANNHIGDFGYEAKETTAKILDSLGISYAGTVEYPWAVRKIRDSLLIGFCAFAPNKGTVNMHDSIAVSRIMRFLEDTCDIVIASVHGGGEGAEHQNILREEEFYFGENRGNMYKFTHELIDMGADIVLGHGPHVSRAIEVYRGRLIAYSLGNFCTYRRFNLNGPNGYAPLIIVEMNMSGELISGRIIPVYQNNDGHVRHDTRKRAVFKIRDLVREDFPESEIDIDDDGNIILNLDYE